MSPRSTFPKISVIIPVYNAQTTLNKTLDSIFCQTLDDFEVIMVDDGSTDCSLKILKKYENKYDKASLLSLANNLGVSNARNCGLQAAKGEYIAFVDSDDLVSPNFLEIMYQTAKNSKSEVVCCNFFYSCFMSKSDKILKRKNLIFVKTGVYSSKKMLKSLIKDTKMHFFVWNKIFKRDLLQNNQIYFEGECFEDVLFTTRAVLFSQKISICGDYLYYYLKRKHSLTSSMTNAQLWQYINTLSSLKKFLQQKNVYCIYKNDFKYLCLRFLVSCMHRIPRLPEKINICDTFKSVSRQVLALIYK